MSRPATARRPAPVVGGNAVLCVPHVRNSPLNFTDPTGHCVLGIVVDTLTCVFVGTLAVAVIYVVAAPDPTAVEDAAAGLTRLC